MSTCGSCNKMYISDEQLHTIEFCIYHDIMIQVEELEGECITVMCQCTGSLRSCGGDQRIDWVWVKQCLGRCYGTRNGRLPSQLQRLYKINLLNQNRAFVEYWLALALTTIPENLGNLDCFSKFVQVRNAPAVVALQVSKVGKIVSCADGIPEIATISKTADEQNEQWNGNSHIDPASSNDVYN